VVLGLVIDPVRSFALARSWIRFSCIMDFVSSRILDLRGVILLVVLTRFCFQVATPQI
jgi:hypothetical protein